MQEEEVVGGCDGDDVLVRMPRRVQDLLVEVEAVDEDLVALALPRRRDLEWKKKFTPLTVSCLWVKQASIAYIQMFSFPYTTQVLKVLRTHFSWLEQRLGLGDLPGRLVGDLLLEVAVEHAEEVVVGAGHNGGIVAVPAALELVKDAVVLIQAAQLRP